MSATRSALLAAVAALLTPDGAGNILLGQNPPQFDSSLRLTPTEWVQQRGIQSAGIIPVAASGNITAADAGGTVTINSASATTQTVAAATNFPNGSRVEFFNIGTGTATVALASGTIRVNGASVASVNLLDGDTAVFESDGTNWYLVGGTVKTFYSFQTSASLIGSGYQKLIGGLIIQWTEFSASTGWTWTFPITFPNACLGFWALSINTGPAIIAINNSTNSNLTGGQWGVNGSALTGDMAIFAIGH